MKTLLFAILLALPLMAAHGVEASRAPRLHLAGDSTMADKPTQPPNPEHGWGQLLPGFFKDPATVINYAANGRSTRSFLAEGRWQKLIDAVQPGDWVIIQFAHNDEKIYPDANGEFQDNLRRFVADVRVKQGNPLLATPCARRLWEDGKLVDTHRDYPEAVRRVANELKVPLLEMNRLTSALESSLGDEGSKRLHLWYPAGAYERQPAGYQDNTHYSAFGAEQVAALAVKEILRLQLPLAQSLKQVPLK